MMQGYKAAAALVLTVLVALTGCGSSSTTQPTPQPPGQQSAGNQPATGQAQGTLPDVIKLGAPLSLSGTSAFAGTKMQKGMQVAEEMINSSGFLGNSKLQLLFEDDGSQKSQAIDVTRKLAVQDKVPAIVGYTASNMCTAALPVAQELKVPTLNADCVAPNLEKIGEYISRLAIPYTAFIQQEVPKVAPALGAKTYAVIYTKENDGLRALVPLFHQLLDAQGLKLVDEETVASEASNDFSTQLTKIAATKPDILVVLLSGAPSANAVLQARQAGMDKVYFLGEQNLNTAEMLRIAGKEAHGAIFPAHWFALARNDENQKFMAAYKAKWKEDPDIFAANGYQGVWLLARVIKKVGSVDREAIKNALINTDEMPSIFGDGKVKLVDRVAQLSAVILTIDNSGSIVLWTAK